MCRTYSSACTRRSRRIHQVWVLCVLGLAAVASFAQGPTPAVRGIVEAFDAHPIVAIAEAHGLRAAGDFYEDLVRDPAFQRLHPEIVIEFASRQSQPLLDAYLLRGASISHEALVSIWRDTTKVASWEFPVYAQWLETIRAVNMALPPSRRMRVLAGDTAVDWPTLQTHADWARLGDNNVSFAEVIENEVLASGRKALVVLGSNHLMRTGTRDDGPNTTTRVEARYPGSMYVVWLYNGRPGGTGVDARMVRERWRKPSLVPLRGNWVGAVPAGRHRFADIADALLYLGPSSSLEVVMAPPVAFDLAYRRELDRRSQIEWGDPSRARRFLGLPAAPQSDIAREMSIHDGVYGRDRRIWVYTPAGYPKVCGDGCDLVIAFDGGVYIDAIPLPGILDSLIADGRMRPSVAVMIDNGTSRERLADLANHADFARFMAADLMPWVRARWRVTQNPDRTLLTGSSAGGLASAFVAFMHPELFGNVVSQSGAFWRGDEGTNGPPFEWLTSQIAHAPRKSIRFALEVGTTESVGAMRGTAPSILAANRHLRSVLEARGYRLSYKEVARGEHAPESWRVRLPAMLAALLSGPNPYPEPVERTP